MSKMKKKVDEWSLNVFIDSLPDAVAIFDSKLNLVEINETGLKMFLTGTDKEDVIGKSIKEIGTQQYDNYMKVIKTGKPLLIEDIVSTPKFGNVHLAVRAFKMGDGIAIVATNITERKKAEEEIRESEEKFRTIFNNIHDMIVYVDSHGNVIDINKRVEEILGHKRDEVIGKNFARLGVLSMKNIPTILRLFGEAIAKGKEPVKIFELEIKDKNGKMIPVEASTKVIKKNGKVVGTINILRDIRERKKADKELRSSEERLRVLFENAPDAIYMNDLKGNFIEGNKAAEELTGYKREELIGKNMAKIGLLPKTQIPKALKNLAKNAMGMPTGPDDFTLIKKDGNNIEVEIRTYPVKIKGETVVLGIARDVTERKRKEEILKKRTEESEKFSKLSVGRELKMVELKKRIRELKKQKEKG